MGRFHIESTPEAVPKSDRSRLGIGETTNLKLIARDIAVGWNDPVSRAWGAVGARDFGIDLSGTDPFDDVEISNVRWDDDLSRGAWAVFSANGNSASLKAFPWYPAAGDAGAVVVRARFDWAQGSHQGTDEVTRDFQIVKPNGIRFLKMEEGSVLTFPPQNDDGPFIGMNYTRHIQFLPDDVNFHNMPFSEEIPSWQSDPFKTNGYVYVPSTPDGRPWSGRFRNSLFKTKPTEPNIWREPVPILIGSNVSNYQQLGTRMLLMNGKWEKGKVVADPKPATYSQETVSGLSWTLDYPNGAPEKWEPFATIQETLILGQEKPWDRSSQKWNENFKCHGTWVSGNSEITSDPVGPYGGER